MDLTFDFGLDLGENGVRGYGKQHGKRQARKEKPWAVKAFE